MCLTRGRAVSRKLDKTYSVQVVQELGSVFFMIGSHIKCVLSQKRLNVYTGMQKYGRPDFFAAARLMAKHLYVFAT